jgi:antitoxin VapB
MTEVTAKTFRSGNSVAVRLPNEMGIEAGVEVVIQRSGDTVTITPKSKHSVAEMIARLRALPKPDYIQEREPIEFPERPGL